MNKIFLNLKNKIFNNDFNKNVLILSGGTVIAQILPIAVSPILSRLYSPSDFGVLALFVSITSIVSVIANGRYELAIMLPEKDEDAINVAAIGFLFNIAISLLFLFLILLFKKPFLKLLNAESLSFWIYFAPLTVFFIGLFTILNYANNRFKLYKDISKATIMKGIAVSSIQLVMGFLKTGVSGLISGQIISQAVANTKLFFNIKNTGLLKEIKKDKIKEVAKRYSNFPKYNLVHALLDSFQSNLIILLFSSFYGIEIVGNYSFSLRILSIPSAFIGSSLYQVTFQKITYMFNKKEKVDSFILKFVINLSVFSLPIFILFYIFSVKLFPIIFGTKWINAGYFLKAMVPWVFFQFIVSPISSFPVILNKQRELFILSIFGKIIIFSIIFAGKFLNLNIIQVLNLFSLMMPLYYIYSIFWIIFQFKKN